MPWRDLSTITGRGRCSSPSSEGGRRAPGCNENREGERCGPPAPSQGPTRIPRPLCRNPCPRLAIPPPPTTAAPPRGGRCQWGRVCTQHCHMVLSRPLRAGPRKVPTGVCSPPVRRRRAPFSTPVGLTWWVSPVGVLPGTRGLVEGMKRLSLGGGSGTSGGHTAGRGGLLLSARLR